MKKLLLTLLTALMLTTAWASPQDALLTAILRNDYATVLEIVRPLALKGDSSAQDMLGSAYYRGEGVLKDYAEAVKWYRLAAQQGNVSAQFHLGLMYRNGRGALQDYVKAHSWFNLSASTSRVEFPDSEKNRDDVAKLMSPQQIAEAQKLARDCQARNFKECD